MGFSLPNYFGEWACLLESPDGEWSLFMKSNQALWLYWLQRCLCLWSSVQIRRPLHKKTEIEKQLIVLEEFRNSSVNTLERNI